MAQLKQHKTNYNMYLGWYGKCGETDCEQKFSLKTNTNIATVYKFTGGTYVSYTQGAADFMNAFITLECGNGYWVVLKPDPNEGSVDIPDFVVSSSQSSSSASGVFPMIKDCNGDGSGGTSNPTPTPKASPTPTPKAAAKKMKLPIVLLGWDTGDTNTSLHFTSNPLLMGGSTKRYATKQDVEEMFNGSGYTWPYAPSKARPTGSAKEYYKAISFSQLDLDFEVLPAGSDAKPSSNNLNDYAYMIPEDYRKCGHAKAGRSYSRLRSWLAQKVFPKVLSNLKASGRDFYKEFWSGVPITIIQAGFSASSVSKNRGDYIWAHKFQFTFRGRKQLYNINPFLGKMTGRGDLDRATISPVGVIIHETLHAFGLPDLYDTSYKGAGINKISVMSSGSYGNAISSAPYLPGYAISWSRAFLANQKKLFNTTIVDIKENTTDIEISPSNDVNKLYRIHHPTKNDVWWVEYRTKESKGTVVNFDKLISESGLAIIHESTDGGARSNKFKQPEHRRGESGYFISIEQRDGKFETQHGTRNISNDLYQPGHEFSPYTVPSSVSRSGVPSGIKIHNIRKTNNGTMKFDVEFITEPSAKIVEVDYSWGNTQHAVTSSKRAEWKESNAYGDLTATIKTQNMADGTKINMQCNPGLNSAVRFSGTVNNNVCEINFTGSQLDQYTRELSKGVTNHLRFSVDSSSNHKDAFPWTDFVTVRP